MLQVYTSRLWTKSPYKLDITIKSGDKAFAPSWKMVMDYKNGVINEEEYTKQYYELMRKSYQSNRERWNELLSQDKVVLCCYCVVGTFCHRYILAEILTKLGATYIGDVE